METIYIEETKGTPRIDLKPNGNLLIKGRSLPIDPIGFYNPVLDWVMSCEASDITLDIWLDYLNTSSSKQLYTIIMLLKENSNVKTLKISWYYEEGDEDGYQTGREFESLVNIPFHFQELAELIDI